MCLFAIFDEKLKDMLFRKRFRKVFDSIESLKRNVSDIHQLMEVRDESNGEMLAEQLLSIGEVLEKTKLNRNFTTAAIDAGNKRVTDITTEQIKFNDSQNGVNESFLESLKELKKQVDALVASHHKQILYKAEFNKTATKSE